MNFRLLPLVLALALLGCPPPPPPDFRVLAEKAYPDGATPDRPALDKLWSSLFKLPNWYFLVSQDTLAKKQPSVEVIGGEPWLLVYTDLNMLKMYAGSNKVLLDGGSLPDAGPLQPAQVVNMNVLPDGGSPFVPSNLVPSDPSLQTVSPNLGKDGEPLYLQMKPSDALKFLKAWSGPEIKGVRFNEGTRKGWFAPVPAIDTIQEMLKANGKI